MDAAAVASVMSLIPGRVARALTGVWFAPAGARACRHPERIAHLGELLHWLSPLYPIAKEDQKLFGLLNAVGRPVHAADLEEEPAEGEAQEALEEEEATA
jgi:hypothetical protein